MTRMTRVYIDSQALLHNVQRIKQLAPHSKIMAMVKANAYGCGLPVVLSALDGHVDAFGVASLDEGLTLRALGSRSTCILMQGIFGAEELPLVVHHDLQCVVHQASQLQWILDKPLASKIGVWVKVDTGMHRLGFDPKEVPAVMQALQACPWVDNELGLMTHLASADVPEHPDNEAQWHEFDNLPDFGDNVVHSMANSAAIMALHIM